MDASGHIATERQSELSFRDMRERGLSPDEIIHIRAAEVAQAKHEHAMRMSLNEFAYEIRDGRLYSPEYKIYFDEIIDPPSHRRSEDYKALPAHVIENLKEAQRLLISGEISKLAILSPNADFAEAENSTAGVVYRMRLVGNKVLVTCSEHSTDSAQMLHEAQLLYGLDSSKQLAGNTIHGGGVYAVSQDTTPTRQEAADAMRAAGNEKLARQYEAAVQLGKDTSIANYMEKLIRQEENNIRRVLAAQNIDAASDPAAAIREVWRYTERALQAVKGETRADDTVNRGFETTESIRQTEAGGERFQFTAPASVNAHADFARDKNTHSYPAADRNAPIHEAQPLKLAAVVDHGRLQADPLYRFLKEPELQGAYTTQHIDGRIVRISGLSEFGPASSASENHSRLPRENITAETHTPNLAVPVSRIRLNSERAELVHLRELFATQEKIRQRIEKIEVTQHAPRFNSEAVHRQILGLTKDLTIHGGQLAPSFLKRLNEIVTRTRTQDLPRHTAELIHGIARRTHNHLLAHHLGKLERQLEPAIFEMRRFQKYFERLTKTASKSGISHPSPEARERIVRLITRLERLARQPRGAGYKIEPAQLERYAKTLRLLAARAGLSATTVSVAAKFKSVRGLEARELHLTKLLDGMRETIRLQRTYTRQKAGKLSALDKQLLDKQERILHGRIAAYERKLHVTRNLRVQFKGVVQKEKQIKVQLTRLKLIAGKLETQLANKKPGPGKLALESRAAKIEVKIGKLLTALTNLRERKIHIAADAARLNRRGNNLQRRTGEKLPIGTAENVRRVLVERSALKLLVQNLSSSRMKALLHKLEQQIPTRVARAGRSGTAVNGVAAKSKSVQVLESRERLLTTILNGTREQIKVQLTRLKFIVQKLETRLANKKDGAPVATLEKRAAKIEAKTGKLHMALADLRAKKVLIAERPLRAVRSIRRNSVTRTSYKLRRSQQLHTLLMQGQEAVSAEMLREYLEGTLEAQLSAHGYKPRSFRQRRRVMQRTARKARKLTQQESKAPVESKKLSARAVPVPNKGLVNPLTGREVKDARTVPSRSLDITQSKEDDDDTSAELLENV